MMEKRKYGNRYLWMAAAIISAAVFLCTPDATAAEIQLMIEDPAPIGPPESAPREMKREPVTAGILESTAPLPPHTFEGIDIDTNNDLTGFLIIPPDPIAAAGPEHIVSIVNSSIEWYSKSGMLRFSRPLGDIDRDDDFFDVLNPQSRPFDPKVIYDQYAGQFLVIALEQDDAGISRILVGISDDENPFGAWYFFAIDSSIFIWPSFTWADYPGLAVDEEAVYITANMFRFGSNNLAGSRLWILEKGDGTGGVYDGGSSSLTRHDPSAAAGMSSPGITLQPAHVFGPGGVAAGVGTFLVNSGWYDNDFNDYLSVIRVDDPLGSPPSPSFSNQFIFLGDITMNSLPDAPQDGPAEAEDIETNDIRVLHAVWRNNSLWLVNTVNPPAGPDAGQATARWYEIDTTDPADLDLIQQGNIGGEEIAAGAHTFFPAIAVDANGNVGIGFSASAPSIFPGAYFTGRNWSDPAGMMRPARTLAAGVDWYVRMFSGTRNRWGDYSGMSVDPADDRTFWVYNEYALTRGSIDSFGDEGRWGTRYSSFLLCEGNFDGDTDVDGLDIKALIDDITLLGMDEFAFEFGITKCLPD